MATPTLFCILLLSIQHLFIIYYVTGTNLVLRRKMNEAFFP